MTEYKTCVDSRHMSRNLNPRLAAVLVLVATFGAAFALIRSPLRGVFGVLAGVTLFVYFVRHRPRTGPIRWSGLLVHIAVVQLLAIVLFWGFARIIARLVM